MPIFEFLKDYPMMHLMLRSGEETCNVRCVMDTCSPYTIIPTSVLKKLKLDTSDTITEVYLHGIIHKKECEAMAPAYMLDVEIDNHTLQDILVVGYDFNPNTGIVGHNVLSNFQLTVNWKQRTISLV